MAIDLDAYFRRIGYRGSREPTIETLRAVNLLHPQAIPFENLDPLMGCPVLLDDASLERKLVKGGRGGYCFEQNQLFGQVLRSMGFDVRGLCARVTKDPPADGPRPRTHMLLQVELGASLYIVDVGFGIAALTAPIRFETDIEQPTPHEVFRLAEEEDEFEMQVKVGADWIGLYRFDLQQQLLADYEMRNWYTSSHPRSQFVTNLMVARPDTGCRHTLRDNVYACRFPTGPARKRVLESIAEMRAVLNGVFRIVLPDSDDLGATLSGIVSR